MIFVDSNVPMYLVGGPHPHKSDAQLILERLVVDGERLVCDAEVMQEILHRYSAIERRDAITVAFNTLLAIVDEVLPIDRVDVLRAAEIVSGPGRYGARDAIHLAVMERYGITRIFSFDRDFERWPGLVRFGAGG